MKSRIEPELTEPYKKNSEDEDFLAKLNDILAPYQEQEYRDLPELYPILHTIGVPRSGTTLLSQLMASHTNIGYINNLIASFWRAPVYGIRLSAKLISAGMPPSYQSDFGRTYGISEPHEFGYFWSSLLHYKEMRERDPADKSMVDWGRARLILNNMTHAFGKPIVFKSFLLGWHMREVQRVLPKTCWIRLRRDPVQNAFSILDMRQKMLGSMDCWASLKPKEYAWLANEPYWRQVAGQVFFIERKHSEQISHLPSTHVLDIIYEQLCNDPLAILEKIVTFLQAQGGDVEITSTPPDQFDYRIRSIHSHPVGGLVEQAFSEFAMDWSNE